MPPFLGSVRIVTAPLVPFLGDVVLLGSLPPAPAPDLGGVVTIYYVRPAGSDSNDGLTPATAFATLKYALSTRLPAFYRNGAFVFDVTTVSESMAGYSVPAPLCDSFFAAYPGGLFGFTGSFTIHADLALFLALTGPQVLAITPDATSGQETITTPAILAPGALVGKIVTQGGFVYGVVKSNTAASIATTASGLAAGVPIELSDPGATLEDFNTTNVTAFTFLEGIAFTSPGGFVGLIAGGVSSDFAFFIGACAIECYSLASGAFLFQCYVRNAPGNAQRFYGGNFTESGCVEIGMTGTVSTGANVDLFFSYFQSGDPLFNGGNTFADITGQMEQCEIKNPASSAILNRGNSSILVGTTKIEGCPSDAIFIEGPSIISAENIPAGVGNLGLGVKLLEGAQLRSNTLGSLLLTGAGGDVKIGNLAVTTWALVTAAPNNRISDFSVNGDGSTAKRA